MNPLSEADSARRIWSDADHGVVARIARAIATRGVHAARVVVLVPYAQLMNVARQRWAEGGPPGFAPRFETTRNWVRSMGGFVPGDYDIAFDMARDLVTAQSLLAQAGFAAERHALAGRLVELALQLASLAAARAPASRASWMQEAEVAVSAGTASDWFRTESALNSIALAWAASSAYATDALLQDEASSQVDLLIVLEGLQADPLVRALAVQWADACLSLPLFVEAVPSGAAAVHEALDPEDEAERAAACVLQALADGCAPVALAATDRALTRRISAQLSAQGVHTQDETGWKLSTTRAAATLMNALRACAHDVSSDQVLDWLKSATAAVDARAVSELEARLRREGLRDWRSWCALIARSDKPHDITLNALTLTVEARRKQLASARSLGDWLRALRRFLEECGLWDALADDLAGSRVIEALWLDAGDIDFAGGRHTLTEFSAWVRDVLEAGSFTRGASDDAPQVVVLPLHQLIGRSFGALVVPGCDDKRLPASPAPHLACRRANCSKPHSAPPGPLRCAARAARCSGGLRTLPASPCDPARCCRPRSSMAWHCRQSIRATAKPCRSCPRCGRRPAVRCCRCARFRRASTKTCAVAPIASLRCGNWACTALTSSTPRSTSATSATGCMRCLATSMNRCTKRQFKTCDCAWR